MVASVDSCESDSLTNSVAATESSGQQVYQTMLLRHGGVMRREDRVPPGALPQGCYRCDVCEEWGYHWRNQATVASIVDERKQSLAWWEGRLRTHTELDEVAITEWLAFYDTPKFRDIALDFVHKIIKREGYAGQPSDIGNVSAWMMSNIKKTRYPRDDN